VLNLRKFIEEIRFKNADIPIYIYGETRTSQHIPNDILRELHGFIHMFEDTPEFVARHIIREAKSYLDGLAPPFFKALMDYAQDGSYSWHCPGHSGGVAFLKSPVGQMFHQFFGENMLRADVCNAVEELGQLLDHTGPVAQSERNAARIFNADHCFFVTNGTSTSNKMVWHHTVAPGDVVVVDRNCHKSILHSIIMTGAVPVFLTPTRNHYGIIGPIPQSEFEPRGHRAQDRKANPLLKGVDPKTVKPRILTLTQSTYDGVLYNTETIKHSLDGYVDTCTSTRPGCRTRPSTSSTAPSTPWARTARGRRTSWCTPRSPRTSCWPASARPPGAGAGRAGAQARPPPLQRGLPDAHQHQPAVRHHRQLRRGCGDDGSAGRHRRWWKRASLESLDFRRAMRKVDKEFGKDWWFKVWGPDKLAADGIGKSADWILKAGAKWHGFGALADGFNMLDPIKCTLITPGLDLSGKFAKTGIPAASSPSSWPSTAWWSRRPACTRSSSCSPSASPRAAGTRC
jgi:arginine decarboxylase